VALATESGPVPGWRTAAFPTPLLILANTTYVATYYAPTGQFTYSNSGLANGVTSPPLTAPADSVVGGNGIYNNGLAFPTLTYEATNYFVDVFFTPAARQTPVLSLFFYPPNRRSRAPHHWAQQATIVATWSDGHPFTGTLGFGPPNFDAGGTFSIIGNGLLINPTGPGVSADGGLVKQITIVATP
jgi:hypothetical protein